MRNLLVVYISDTHHGVVVCVKLHFNALYTVYIVVLTIDHNHIHTECTVFTGELILLPANRIQLLSVMTRKNL